jgi:hypothetical protein
MGIVLLFSPIVGAVYRRNLNTSSKKPRFSRADVIKFRKNAGGMVMFRILVVEDDDSARFLMCEVVRVVIQNFLKKPVISTVFKADE